MPVLSCHTSGVFPGACIPLSPERPFFLRFSRKTRRALFVPALLLLVFCLASCGAKKFDDPAKYRTDLEEMMPVYTPRDDGVPLSPDELYAFKTVSDFDRNLSEEEARIVELHFKFFAHQHRAMFERFLERSSRFLPHIRATFSARGIPEDIAYLCMVESGGNPNAKSPAGAAGLWQFMPFTGRKFGLTQNAWVDERRDPYKATYAASDYLLKLYSDFSDWQLAVAAYNAGEGKIGRAVSGTGATGFFELCRLDDRLDEKSRLREETRDYVPRLIAVAKIMRNLRRLGFSSPAPGSAWNLSPLTVPPGTNLAGLAQHLGLTWDEFSGMNPAFRRTASPPAASSTAYVPPEKLGMAVTWVAGGQARAFAGWKEYTVKKGDSLASIAKRHKVSVAAIREANAITALPARGTSLLIPGGPAAEKVYDALPETASSPSASAGVHIVRPGDTLTSLAQQWGTDPRSIRLANRMGSGESLLKPGRRISIPGNSTRRPAASAPGRGTGSAPDGARHSVRSGDTIYSIAGKFGVSVQDLCDANNLDRARPDIRPGMSLLIPGKSGAAAPARRVSSAAPETARESGREKARAPEKRQSGGKAVIVKAGDTLYGIARSYKISVSALSAANNLGRDARLKPGQKLVLP